LMMLLARGTRGLGAHPDFANKGSWPTLRQSPRVGTVVARDSQAGDGIRPPWT